MPIYSDILVERDDEIDDEIYVFRKKNRSEASKG